MAKVRKLVKKSVYKKFSPFVKRVIKQAERRVRRRGTYSRDWDENVDNRSFDSLGLF